MISEGERRVVVNGVEHWCRVAATDRDLGPLVVVHGGPGGNNYAFERTIGRRLEAFATVVYYEQRGCGRSAAPARDDDYSMELLVDDLDKLRATLGLSKVVTLGYSFGAEIALAYAIVHPQRLGALIAQAPGEEDPERAAAVQLAGYRRVVTPEARRWIERIAAEPDTADAKMTRIWRKANTELVDRFLFEHPRLARINRELWRESGLVNTGAMERALRGSGQLVASRERLKTVRTPTLVLVGRHDRNCGVRASEVVAECVPGARLHIFERSAHFPDIEEPDLYAEVVRGFLIGVNAAYT